MKEKMGNDGSRWSLYSLLVPGDDGGKQASFQGNCKLCTRNCKSFLSFPFFGNDPLFVRPFPFCLRCGTTFGAFTGTFWSLLCGTLSYYVSNFSGHVRLSISFLLGSDLTVVVALSIVFTGRMRGCRLSPR